MKEDEIVTKSKTASRFIALVAAMSLIGLAGCSAGDGAGSPTTQQTDAGGSATAPSSAGTDADASAESADSGQPADTQAPTDTPAPEAASGDGVDADGFVIPGEVVPFEIGQPVTYYSMPRLTLDDAQRVTINSFEYIDATDIPDDDAVAEVGGGDGVLVLNLSWEAVLGDVQSNDGYVKAYLGDSDEHADPLYYRDDELENGGVDAGPAETGTYTYIIDRGPTKIVLTDYRDVPVGELHIDTSK